MNMTIEEKKAMISEAHGWGAISQFERDRLLNDLEKDPTISWQQLVEWMTGIPEAEWPEQ